MSDDRYSNFSFEELKNECLRLENEVKNLKKIQNDLDNHSAERVVDLNYKLLLESSFDWFWSIDADNNYNYCSEQVEKIIGYKPEELIGKSPFDIMSENERNRILPIFENVIKNKSNVNDLENWVEKKDGSKVCLLTNAYPLLNKDGKIVGFQGADKDITIRKNAEKRLQESELRFQAIVEDLMVGIVIHNGDIIKYVNPHLMKMIQGNNINQFIGKSIFDYIYKEDHQIVIDKFNNVQSLKDNENNIVLPPINIRIYKTDGTLLDVETHSILIEYENEEHTLAIIQDITERINDKNRILKALMRSEESDALKTAFLQNLSHEIRTPLNGILGFSSLLGNNDDLDKSETQEIVKFIQESGKRLINIVEQIIEISKIETEQLTVDLRNFSVYELLDDIELYHTFDIHSRSLQFDNDKTNYPDINISSDYKKIHQIFSNLIENAAKFTHKGKITIGHIIKDNELIFYVKDTGIGIPEENKTRIFEKFSQVDFQTSRKFEGAGIGLAICKGLTKLLGGNIWFDSSESSGSTFYFSLPLNSDLEKSQMKNVYKSLDSLKNRILVVDDDESYLKYCNKIFSNINIKILSALNAWEALEILKSNDNIALMITDIIMPEMDGLTLSIKSKEMKANLKIIAQTTYSKIGEINKIAEFGIDAVVFKPAEKDELFSLIDSIFSE